MALDQTPSDLGLYCLRSVPVKKCANRARGVVLWLKFSLVPCASKALERLRKYAGSQEPSLFAYSCDSCLDFAVGERFVVSLEGG